MAVAEDLPTTVQGGSASEDSPRRSPPWLTFAAPVVCAGVVGLLTSGANLQAQFGPVDDHEPLRWMHDDGRLGPRAAWSAFWGSEVGDWGTFQRWRPAYYGVRVMQAMVLGDSPTLWYLSVLAMFVATCAIGGLATARLFEGVGLERWAPLTGSVAAILFAAMPTWSGVATRLGPSEQLGLLAFAVAGYGFTRLALGADSRWWVPASLGVTCAVFAKETFGAVAVLGLVVAVHRWRSSRDRSDIAWGTTVTLPAVIVGLVLVPHLESGDVYGRSVGWHRVADGIRALIDDPGFRVWRWSMVILVITVVGSWTRLGSRRFLVSGFVGWCAVTALADAWFYGGDYWAPRYRAMIDTLTIVQVLAVLLLVLTNSLWRPIRFGIGSLTLVLLAMIAIDGLNNVQRTSEAAQRNRDATRRYQRDLDRLELAAGDHADSPVVIVAPRGEYEGTVAIALEVGRRRNGSVFVVVDNSESPLAELARAGRDEWNIDPIRELDRAGFCAFVNVDPTPRDECLDAVTVEVLSM
jgi:hypothetical protein